MVLWKPSDEGELAIDEEEEEESAECAEGENGENEELELERFASSRDSTGGILCW